MEENDNRNILIVVTSMGVGGLETYIVNFLSAITKKKYTATIVFTKTMDNWYKTELNELGIKVIFCRNPYTQVGYIYGIYRIIRKLEIDTVCDFRGDFSASTLFAAKIAGVRNRVAMYRSSRHGFKPDLLRNVYASIMHLCTKVLATKIIGNTIAVLDAFFPNRKGNEEKYVIVNNGVDLNKFPPNISGKNGCNELGISTNTIVIGHVGRFHVSKNHGAILDAFSMLREITGNVHLLLVGDGALRIQIEKKIESLNMQKDVTLVGRRKDVSTMLGAMDIFYYPSVYEGLPNAVLEAMACGLPIVASNISEIKEILPSGLHGQLYDCDDIEGFVFALKSLYLDENKRNKLGDLGREWIVKNFTIEASAENLCKHLFDNID